MSDDRFIEFQESNYEKLVEKFIEKHQKEFDDFVYDEYADSCHEPTFGEDR